MHGTIIHTDGSSNLRDSKAGPSLPHSGAIIAAVKNIFSEHARKTLARLLGLSDGGARKKLTGERAFTADELAALLRSEHGLDFLSAIMADAEPKWWVTVHSAFKLGAMRRHKLQLQDAIHEAERLGDTLARAETALGFCGPNGDRKAGDALGPIAGRHDRPVVGGRRR